MAGLSLGFHPYVFLLPFLLLVNVKSQTTESPSFSPSFSPTGVPTQTPVLQPTQPTDSPVTQAPTFSPTFSPTSTPIVSPSLNPTLSPTKSPSKSPTFSPTSSPSTSPTLIPTSSPTNPTTSAPTTGPTLEPNAQPTTQSPTASPNMITVPLVAPPGIRVNIHKLIILFRDDYRPSFHESANARSKLSDIVALQLQVQRGQAETVDIAATQGHVAAQVQVNQWIPGDEKKDFSDNVIDELKSELNSAKVFGVVILIRWEHGEGQPEMERLDVPAVNEGKEKTTLIAVLTSIFIIFGGAWASLCIHEDHDYESERNKRLDGFIPNFSKRAYKAAAKGLSRDSTFQKSSLYSGYSSAYQIRPFNHMEL